MKLVILNYKLIGEKLAMPIYNTNGILFLNKGSVITKTMIDKLNKMGIHTFYIEDENDNCNLQEVINPVIKISLIKKLKEEFSNISKAKFIDYSIIEYIAKSLIENINLSENAFLFNNIGKMDDDLNLSIHSIDVAIICIMIGASKKYDSKKLLNLTLGAILHDVGKLISNNENHPKVGYRLIKDNTLFTSTTAIAVLHHHENINGTGFPEKISGDKIYEFAKIVGISNEYINTLKEKNVYFPMEVIEKLMAQTNIKFDIDTYKSFASAVCCYPNGINVQLNNGEKGVVIMQNKNFPLRPIIEIRNSSAKKFVNLIKEYNITIDKIIIEE